MLNYVCHYTYLKWQGNCIKNIFRSREYYDLLFDGRKYSDVNCESILKLSFCKLFIARLCTRACMCVYVCILVCSLHSIVVIYKIFTGHCLFLQIHIFNFIEKQIIISKFMTQICNFSCSILFVTNKLKFGLKFSFKFFFTKSLYWSWDVVEILPCFFSEFLNFKF